MGYEIEDARCVTVRYKNGKPHSLLVDAPEFEEPAWFPYDHVTDESEVYRKGDQGTFIISEWLAEQRGFL